MYKKGRWCRCIFVVLLSKPIAFLQFSLSFPSSLLKLPNLSNSTNLVPRAFPSISWGRGWIFHEWEMPLNGWNMKITARNIKRRYKYRGQCKIKRRNGWNARDSNCGFWNFVLPNTFSKFVFVVLTFDMMLERQVFSTRSCELISYQTFSSVGNTERNWHY